MLRMKLLAHQLILPCAQKVSLGVRVSQIAEWEAGRLNESDGRHAVLLEHVALTSTHGGCFAFTATIQCSAELCICGDAGF